MAMRFRRKLLRKIPEEDGAQDSVQAAEALLTAHHAGLIHGRLTSNNLLLTQEGDLKIFRIWVREPP